MPSINTPAAQPPSYTAAVRLPPVNNTFVERAPPPPYFDNLERVSNREVTVYSNLMSEDEGGSRGWPGVWQQLKNIQNTLLVSGGTGMLLSGLMHITDESGNEGNHGNSKFIAFAVSSALWMIGAGMAVMRKAENCIHARIVACLDRRENV